MTYLTTQRKELTKGIKKTLKYALSHHTPAEYYKCYSLKLRKKIIHFCARCVGIYLGLVMGTFLYFSRLVNETACYLIILVFPIFTLIDWSITSFSGHRGNNFFRTSSGLLLGIAYSIGVLLFLFEFPNLFVIFVGTAYMLSAGLLIYLKYYA